MEGDPEQRKPACGTTRRNRDKHDKIVAQYAGGKRSIMICVGKESFAACVCVGMGWNEESDSPH